MSALWRACPMLDTEIVIAYVLLQCVHTAHVLAAVIKTSSLTMDLHESSYCTCR